MSSASAPRDPFRRGFSGGQRRPRALLPTIVAVIVLGLLFAVFTNLWTERQWYAAIDYSTVFSTQVWTRAGLFVVFGLVFAAVVFGNLALAYRLRPRYRAMSSEQQTLDRYREVVDPRKLLIGLVLAGVIGAIAGSNASGRWDTYLQWVNATPFGTADPEYGMDMSFYLFGYPWYRFLLGFGFVLVLVSAIGVAITHYIYGGIRLQTPGQKMSAAAQAHLSVLVGLFILLKAVAYWFDRYGLMLGQHSFDQQEFTGITYSDAHALAPAKTILTFIAVICALLFFANLVRRTLLLPGLGLGLLVLSAVLLGWAWPTVIQLADVTPNEPDRERPYIAENLKATKEAYGIADAEVENYRPKTEANQNQLSADDDVIPGIRLVDPTVVPRTFEQLQQVRGFYSFSDPLDVGRYDVDGEDEDTVLAVRELNLDGISDSQRNWNNDHTVFTHGYGVVAAYGNRQGEEGNPEWMEGGIPPKGELGKYEPRVYYGEESPAYSFVGVPKGTAPREMDRPSSGSGDDESYTYDGKGGVPMGSLLDRVLYASRFQDFNILLSDRINSETKVMYDRHPRERVEKVAPWLTVDSDAYPAVVDGRVVWIVDAYTMSDSYPMSQLQDVQEATSDSLSQAPAIAGQPSQQLNYVRNSVKAVVDAYDGTVDLYAWEDDDPMLKTWTKAFPDTVKPRSEMPDELLDHVRYPYDMMKIQREILSMYHVDDPLTWYNGSERWRIPSDPAEPQSETKQPGYYLSVKMPGQDEPQFSLTSTFIYDNRQNLAAFAAVNADARSDDYGKMHVLRVVGTDQGGGADSGEGQGQVDGPRQIANKLESDNAVADALLPFKRAGNDVVNGNLLTLPVGGGLLYVQPIYVEREGEGAYPLMRLVLSSFGGNIGVGTTLQDSLDMTFGGESGADTEEETDTGEDNEGGEPTGPPSSEVQQELAAAADSFEAADKALSEGNLGSYENHIKEAEAAVQRAMDLQAAAQQSGGQDGQNGRNEGPPDGNQSGGGQGQSGEGGEADGNGQPGG